MKKNIGILLIIIVGLNIVSWFADSYRGNSESPIYYIFIIALFVLGIYLINNSSHSSNREKNKKITLDRVDADQISMRVTRNINKWAKVYNDNEIPNELRSVIYPFFIKDNIEIDKFIENEKAKNLVENNFSLNFWEKANSLSVDEEQKNRKINCSPSFRMHYSSENGTKAPGIPSWFYIAYPDVAFWFHENNNELEKKFENRMSEFYSGDSFNLSFYREIIEIFKKHGELECSII